MKRTVLKLLASGLLTGIIAGAAIACGGSDIKSKTDGVDVIFESNEPNESNESNEPNEPNEPNENDENDENDENIDNGDYDDMKIPAYYPSTGTIASIEEAIDTRRLSIEDEDGNPAVLLLTEDTVFPFAENVNVGDIVTGWYSTEGFMIMIWPPEYTIAVLSAGAPADANIKVDRFKTWEDSTEDLMISQDEQFAFRIDEGTEIILANGDAIIDGDLGSRRIAVIYDISTRSIPEIATARKLIVLYEDIVPLSS